MTPAHGALARRLGTGDAVVVGVSAMIGAGVYAVFAPAAAAAGTGLLVGLALAALVALANATSSAQLAAQHPTSGGTYVYGREHLGPWWGYVAGWGFVVGKTASCAAMALVVGAYVAPDGWERSVAAAVVVVLTTIGYRGVTRTAQAARVLVVVTLLALATAVAAGATSGAARWSVLGPEGAHGGWYGVLQSAGLLFFAFAGYARLATLGEEVRDPRRTIPRAILLALGVAVAVYAVVAVTLLAVLGPDGLAASTAPVADAATAGGQAWAGPVVAVGAVAASTGALLALLAGVSRTTLAMARTGDLPRWLDAVHPRFAVPHHAELVVGGVVVLLVLVTDLRGAIGFSSFGVLVYYLVANLSALRQHAPHRLYPRGGQVLGAVGCVVLVATLPPSAVAAGAVVLAVGVGLRWWRVRRAGGHRA
ncbi:APC family permease [Cellulosimicrobium marinum]|uniref:APC family permease n=1 Tax=Cellulosimicrobium marinum TaxID=1638992 RepID=UPI001E4A1B67|nr:APC family permease [Cellulosimicrobium marinum]MCB7136162.1 APC family permease [Cellulosimicrobium marinum]